MCPLNLVIYEFCPGFLSSFIGRLNNNNKQQHLQDRNTNTRYKYKQIQIQTNTNTRSYDHCQQHAALYTFIKWHFCVYCCVATVAHCHAWAEFLWQPRATNKCLREKTRRVTHFRIRKLSYKNHDWEKNRDWKRASDSLCTRIIAIDEIMELCSPRELDRWLNTVSMPSNIPV